MLGFLPHKNSNAHNLHRVSALARKYIDDSLLLKYALLGFPGSLTLAPQILETGAFQAIRRNSTTMVVFFTTRGNGCVIAVSIWLARWPEKLRSFRSASCLPTKLNTESKKSLPFDIVFSNNGNNSGQKTVAIRIVFDRVDCLRPRIENQSCKTKKNPYINRTFVVFPIIHS